jgi:hypothetical protein
MKYAPDARVCELTLESCKGCCLSRLLCVTRTCSRGVRFDLERKLLVPLYLLALHSCSVGPTVIEEVLPGDAAARALVDTIAAELGRKRAEEDVEFIVAVNEVGTLIHSASVVANDN